MLEVEISLRRGSFSLGGRFDVEGFCALQAPSGAGKSSLIHAIAGLIRPEAGRIVLNGRVLFDAARGVDLAPQARRVGVVFQEGRLFEHLTVRQNLGYGRFFARMRRRAVLEIGPVVEMLGIGPLLARRPHALSGGERQRVALGRALLSAPEILLLDEPLAALDAARKAEILPYLERLRDAGGEMLYVSHDPAELARLARGGERLAIEAGRIVPDRA